ncbi:MAG: amidohydrolase family protein, partial [Bacteroidota bacterium]|nr:amidohydrolase family protein [Bacteroidota bacterium]
INAAYDMGVGNEVGSITVGKKANIIITKPINHYYQLPYNFGTDLIESVMISGEIQ